YAQLPVSFNVRPNFMPSKNEKLGGLGRAVQRGDSAAIVAHVVGRAERDSDNHLSLKSRRLTGEDFSGRRLDSFSSIASTFRRCDFRGMRIADASWGAGRRKSTYEACSFDGSHFSSISPGNARFVGCTFHNVNVAEFCAHDVELIDCAFSGMLKKGFLNGSRDRTKIRLFGRRRNVIRGNDFASCEFRDFTFRTGVDLSQQVLPIGDKYVFLSDPTLAIRVARPIVAEWGNSEMQRLASVVLEMWEHDIRDGQKQLFSCIPDSGEFSDVYKELRHIVERTSA
ncbi:MAG: hypothetical protein OEQ39_22245, partial [Gammaproteobacteria bacterium]|nr:hypothetical protein [Gammaproteobacteria bacterium]